MAGIKGLVEAVDAACDTTRITLGRLTPKQARMVVDSLVIERQATNHLINELSKRVVYLTELLGSREQANRDYRTIIRNMDKIMEHYGIERPALPDEMTEETH